MHFESLNIIVDNSLIAAGGIAAEPFGIGFLTNSILVAAIVTTIILLFTRMATKKMELIPGKGQNFVEFLLEAIYGQVEAIVGAQVAKRAFPLLATLFIFILVSNWFGLVPGVGTIGFGPKSGFLTIDEAALHAEASHGVEDVHEALEEGKTIVEVHAEHEAHDDHNDHAGDDHGAAHDDHDAAHFTPLLRPPTADLNMTFGMAAVFMIVWFYITMREAGPVEFLKHMFAPKGGLTGFMKYALMPVFAFVGIIEVISIVFRPLSLSVRLLGNVFAGETLLHTMGELGSKLHPIAAFITKVVFPLPFYFLEILVGLLQAAVFTLLCAVYIQLSTAHDEEAH